MIFRSFLSRLWTVLPLGITVFIIVNLLFTLGYFGFCKKRHPMAVFPWWRLLLWNLLLCYIAVLINLALLQRGTVYTWYNFDFLSSYRKAWNTNSASEWEFIILNILAFVPLGVLLPLLFKRFRSVWLPPLAGFAASLTIETVQYVTSMGIFDVDDLFNNTVGALLGGCLSVGILHILHRDKPARKTLLPFILLSLAALGCIGFRVFYDTKELGNISYAYSRRQNMKNVTLSCTLPLTDENPVSALYKTRLWTEDEARAFAGDFFARLGASFDSRREPSLYSESAYYYSDKDQILIVDYRYKSFLYTDYTFAESEPSPDADEEQIRHLLGDFGIDVPDSATYSKGGGGEHTFMVKMQPDGGSYQNGILTCAYYADGTIKTIDSSLTDCEYVRDCDLISQQEAYAQIEAGRFSHNEIDLHSVDILSVHLWYTLDTKGFFQPVYRFGAVLNGSAETVINIPALA